MWTAKGFSLVDTLLGVGMFLVVTVALIQFTLTTLRAADDLSLQVSAQNSAREGLEIMENIRGTNAISFVTWSTPEAVHPHRELHDLVNFGQFGTTGEVCLTVEPQDIGSTSKSPWNLTPFPCPAVDVARLPDTTRLFRTQMRHGEFLTHAPTGESTGLYRYIKLTKAAKSSLPDLNTLLSAFNYTRQEQHDDDDIVHVEAVVRWDSRGKGNELRLHKILTDWYQ